MAEEDSVNKSRSFLFSKIFKVIGPGKTTFRVHGDLLARKSKVFAKAVHGPMSESGSKTILIEAINEDLDDDTVMRFLEYVYTKDYPVPDPEILQLPSDPEHVTEAFASNIHKIHEPVGEDIAAPEPAMESPVVESPQDILEVEREWGFSSSKKLKKDKKKKKAICSEESNQWYEYKAEPVVEPELVEEFRPKVKRETSYEGEIDLPFVTGKARASSPPHDPFKSSNSQSTRSQMWEEFCLHAETSQPDPWLPPANNDQREDFTPILLCHARLYKFSDRYESPELMELSLQKLRLTLSRYRFHQERAADVVDLIRYTYQHTMEFEQGQDKLRSLVLQYAVCYIHQLSKEQSFLDLLKEAGSLASDLLVRTVGLFD